MRAEIMTSETYPLSIGGDIIATEDQLLEKVERGITMSGSSVKYLIVHCSATREDRDYTVEQLRRDHLARGFIDIGYHYYIRKDGTVTRHRRLTEVGAHCRPYNRCSIGVCYEGGLAPDGSPIGPTISSMSSFFFVFILSFKVFLCERFLFHGNHPRAFTPVVLRAISALYRTDACVVRTVTIDVVFSFNDMTAF